jgi:2-polyprenyl-3-methyl-5-hydroxy-6-metoxy-1,4-benzoquinol methylase
MKAENFMKFVELVYKKAPLQKKKLERYLKGRPEVFFQEAENFSKDYIRYLTVNEISLDYAVSAYLKMCDDMMKCQISFMKTGSYPVQLSGEAFDKVYNNHVEMKSYMIGLALSQFLWPTHYSMFSCLLKSLSENKDSISSYLEIGPGHGLFLTKAVDLLGANVSYTAVDISPTSMEITQSIINYLFPEKSSLIDYRVGDMLELDINNKFDFITMGEVIEHVNFPDKLLLKLRDLLSDSGHGFISTCVDCPAIDHVYHFKSVEEIREMITNCGLKIVSEEILPVEDLPLEEIKARRITINYCAIVEKIC